MINNIDDIDANCPCDQYRSADSLWSPTCIGQLWLFEGLSDKDLTALAAKALRISYESGQVIFSQGEKAQLIFLIKTGHVRLNRVLADGSELTLDIRKPGDCLGEYILNDDFTYPVSAWCLGPVMICGLTKELFEQLIQEHPRLGLQTIKNLARRISLLTERVAAMSQNHLEDRLYDVLLNVAKEHGRKMSGGYEIKLPLTHEDLGFLIGAHRVSVTRVLKRLKTSGKISQKGRTITIANTYETKL